ncbi:hypothetical protein [Paraburkholderia sp.]|uniref:hypothetical protein n=1 Tax=Paraburkholderia sp. TaxID=1926495 RepID=UPI0039E3BBAB
MTTRHPLQDTRMRVNSGSYRGRLCKVIRVLMDHGENGFAEVEFDPPKDSRTKVKERDLVPLPYLTHAGQV